MDEILGLLRENARLSTDDIAAMTKKDRAFVERVIKQLEDDGIILKYAAVVDHDKIASQKGCVRAEIEVQVTPERDTGFDGIAERIYRFPQVKSLYLMSGGYDLKVVVEGANLQEVSYFIAHKLSPLSGVKSTKTHFLLKTYKENDVIYAAETKDFRQEVSA